MSYNKVYHQFWSHKSVRKSLYSVHIKYREFYKILEAVQANKFPKNKDVLYMTAEWTALKHANYFSYFFRKFIKDAIWLAVGDSLPKSKTNKLKKTWKIQFWTLPIMFSQVVEAKSIQHLILCPSLFKDRLQLLEKYHYSQGSYDVSWV